MRKSMVALLLVLAGCQQNAADPFAESRRLEQAEHAVPLTPEMKEFVEARYREAVLSGIATPATANAFPPTTVIASENGVDHSRHLWAHGEFDAQNDFGATVRSTYLVSFNLNAKDDGFLVAIDGSATHLVPYLIELNGRYLHLAGN